MGKLSLIAWTRLAPMQEKISRAWTILLGIAVALMLATLIIGWVLSEQILRPVADLTLGVKAIDRREFEYRIPVHAQDEFWELSSLMNKVMDGMSDLEIARVVQESL